MHILFKTWTDGNSQWTSELYLRERDDASGDQSVGWIVAILHFTPSPTALKLALLNPKIIFRIELAVHAGASKINAFVSHRTKKSTYFRKRTTLTYSTTKLDLTLIPCVSSHISIIFVLRFLFNFSGKYYCHCLWHTTCWDALIWKLISQKFRNVNWVCKTLLWKLISTRKSIRLFISFLKCLPLFDICTCTCTYTENKLIAFPGNLSLLQHSIRVFFCLSGLLARTDRPANRCIPRAEEPACRGVTFPKALKYFFCHVHVYAGFPLAKNAIENMHCKCIDRSLASCSHEFGRYDYGYSTFSKFSPIFRMHPNAQCCSSWYASCVP